MTPCTCFYLPWHHVEDFVCFSNIPCQTDWVTKEITHHCAYRFDTDWLKKSGRNCRLSRYHQRIHGCQEPNCSEVKCFGDGDAEADSVRKRWEITWQSVFLAQGICYIVFYPDARKSVVFFFHIVATQKNIFNKRLQNSNIWTLIEITHYFTRAQDYPYSHRWEKKN